MNINGTNSNSVFQNITTNDIFDFGQSVDIKLTEDTIDLIGTNILANGNPIGIAGEGVQNPLNADLNIGNVYDIIDNSGLSLRGINNNQISQASDILGLQIKTQNISSLDIDYTQITGNLTTTKLLVPEITDELGSSSIVLNTGGVNITSDTLNFNNNTVLSATGLNTQYFMGDGSLLTYSANSGNSNFYLYQSHTNTPAPPPDEGFINYNNSNQSLATIIYISHITDDVIDIEVFFNNINQINDVYLQDKNNSSNFIKYNITGTPTITVGSHITIPVSVISSSGNGSTSFGINHPILLSFFTNTIEVDTRLSSLETKTQYQTGLGGNITAFTGELLVSGETNSGTFRKSGGLSSQFLKANGTVDSNTYATTTITDGLLSKKLFIKNLTVGILLGVPYVDICPTVIGNLTIPANSVKEGDIYALTIEGAYVMTSNSARPVIRLTIGGNVFNAADIFPSTSGSFGFKFISKFSFFTIGAVSTGSSITTLETGSLSGTAINSQMAFLPGSLSTFNTTIANTVLIEAHSTSATITVNLAPYFLFMSKI